MRLLTSVVFLVTLVASCTHYSGTPDSTWAAYSRATEKTQSTRRP